MWFKYLRRLEKKRKEKWWLGYEVKIKDIVKIYTFLKETIKRLLLSGKIDSIIIKLFKMLVRVSFVIRFFMFGRDVGGGLLVFLIFVFSGEGVVLCLFFFFAAEVVDFFLR